MMKIFNIINDLGFKFNIIIFFALPFYCSAQNSTSSVSANLFFGNAVGKYKGVDKNQSSGFLINFEKSLENNPAEWVRFLNAKNIAVGVIYTDMNNIQYPIHNVPYSFGKSFGIISHIDLGIISKNRFNLYLSPGFGLAYINKTIKTNPESFVFGSHINAIFKTALKGEIELGNNYSVLSEINFLHFSNGSFRIPNAGVNFMNASIGIKKKFNIHTYEIDSTASSELIKMPKNAFLFSAGMGRRGKYKRDDAFYRLHFYGGYSKFLNNVIAIKSGVDLFYYEETYNPNEYEDSITYLGETNNHFKSGVSIGTEVKLNRFSITANLGYYLYFKSVYPQKTYWNIGFKYYLDEHFGVQTNLNAHQFQADFISGGVFILL